LNTGPLRKYQRRHRVGAEQQRASSRTSTDIAAVFEGPRVEADRLLLNLRLYKTFGTDLRGDVTGGWLEADVPRAMGGRGSTF